MDYQARLNLQRVNLNDEALYEQFTDYIGNRLAKVSTKHYELQQAKALATAFIEANGLEKGLFYRLWRIAICVYRLKF